MSIFEIYGVTLSLFVLIALGYVARWQDWIPASALPGFGSFVRSFAVPAAIFLGVSGQDVSSVFQLGFVLAFGTASFLSLTITYFVARFIQGESLAMSGIWALGGGTSNGIMMGLPLVTALFGTVAIAAIAQQLMVETLFLIPLGLLLSDMGANEKGRFGQRAGKTLLGVVRNPMVIAALLGLLFASMDWGLPGALERSVSLIAASSSGMALVFIGAALYGADVRTGVRRVLAVVAVKSALHPTLMALMFWMVFLSWKTLGWMPLDPVLANAGVIIGSLPTIGILPALAARFGEERSVALGVILMNVASFFITPLTIWLLLTYQPFA